MRVQTLARYYPLVAALWFACPPAGAAPLKALLLTSPGIYHDYAYQTEAIANALASRMDVQFDVSLAETARWQSTDYGRGYDLLVYNICMADDRDAELIANMRRQTEELGVPALMVHCALHSFRDTELWWPLPGLKTVAHEPLGAMSVQHAANHPVLAGLPLEWSLAEDELYINLAFTATPLLTARGEDGAAHVIAWLHEANGTRVFGTTLGHSVSTIDDPAFQRLLGNALLWLTGRLGEDGAPQPGLDPVPGRPAIDRFDRAPGVDFLDDDTRSCLRTAMAKAVGPCYAGCVFNPLQWGAASRACKDACIAGMPPQQALLGACAPR